ncbi:MAG: acid--CoA ligase [Cyanobacteria bacterium]|nr:acid--CoA ligase [Cyanobacteriota bacterium]
MRIIAFIEDYKIARKILDYLKIDEFKRDRPPPRALKVFRWRASSRPY